MPNILEVDLKSIVAGTLTEVCENMLSMRVSVDTEGPFPEITSQRIVGTVGFAGDVSGSVRIHLPERFAEMIAAAMMGCDEDDLEPDEVQDTVGELCNMLAGWLKSQLNDMGFPCKLSIPSITIGKDFHIQAVGWIRMEKMSFSYLIQKGLVEVFIKSNTKNYTEE